MFSKIQNWWYTTNVNVWKCICILLFAAFITEIIF